METRKQNQQGARTGAAAPGQPAAKKPAETKALTLPEKVQNIEKVLDDNKAKIKKALGRWITYDRMLMLLTNSIRRTPELADCTPISVYSSIMQSAQLGLELDDIRGLAYLVPRWNRKKTPPVLEAQFMPGYKGFVKLGKDSGEVKNVYARVVYSNEPFSIQEGLEPDLKHTPLPPDKRGEPVATYAVVEFKDDTAEFTLVWEAEIQKIRGRSPASGSGPWVTDEDWMRKKTAIRQAMKLRNLSPKVDKAVALDERLDADVSSQEEFDAGEFATETLKGKPLVPEPQAVDEPAASAQPAAQEPAEAEIVTDAGVAAEITALQAEMAWDLADERRAKTAEIFKNQGASAALDYVQQEHDKWKASTSDSRPAGSTPSSGAATR